MTKSLLLVLALSFTTWAAGGETVEETRAWVHCPQPNGHSLRKFVNGWFSLVRKGQVLWTARQTECWSWGIAAGEGKWALTAVGNTLYIWNGSAKARKLVLPAHLKPEGELYEPKAWFYRGNFYLLVDQVQLLRLEPAGGAWSLVTPQEVPPLIRAPACPDETAYLLAAIHGVKLPERPMRDGVGYAAYQQRFGESNPSLAERFGPPRMTPAGSILNPKITSRLMIADRLENARLTSRLCRPEHLAQLKALTVGDDPHCRAAALLAWRGDAAALKRIDTALRLNPEDELIDLACSLDLQSGLVAALDNPRVSIPNKILIIQYFESHPRADAIEPILRFQKQQYQPEFYYPHPFSYYTARSLTACARVDLGEDPKVWLNWSAKHRRWTTPELRARGLAQLGEPSALLWLGRRPSTQELLTGLNRRSRCLNVLPLGPTDKLRFVDNHTLWRQAGQVDDGCELLNVASGAILRKISAPVQFQFQWNDQADKLLFIDPVTRKCSLGDRQNHDTWVDCPEEVQLTADGFSLIAHHPIRAEYVGGTIKTWETKSVSNRPGPGQPALVGQQEATTVFSDDTQWGEVNLHDGAKRHRIKGKRGELIAISPDGLRLVFAAQDLKIFNRRSGQTRSYRRPADRSGPAGCEFSPDGRYLAITDCEMLHVLDTNTGKFLSRSAAAIQALYWSPDQSRLAVTNAQQIDLLATKDLSPVESYRVAGNPALAFSPNSRYLAAAANGEVTVWELQPELHLPQSPDPQLLSELWTGQRLKGGASHRLSSAEFAVRRQQWLQRTGAHWPAP